jgi:choline-sulfatase
VRLRSRFLLVFSGGVLAIFVTALLEASSVLRIAESAGQPSPPFRTKAGLFAAEIGVLAPFVIAFSVVIGLASLIGAISGTTLVEDIRAIRATLSVRTRAAAMTPLVIVGSFFALVAAAHLGRVNLGHGTPAESGLATGLATVLTMLLVVIVAFALLPSLWSVIANYGRKWPSLTDPLVTGAAALVVVAIGLASGLLTGDSGGAGGLPGVGMFAVLTRPELDLRPVAYTLIVLGFGLLGGQLVVVDRRARLGIVGVALALAALGFTARASYALGDTPVVADFLEQAPVGGRALALLRRFTDRDHDGYSARFGGGDCDDHDPRVSPGATDIPGNRIDEDCSGDDAPVIAAETPPEQVAATPKRTFNVVLFTVDTFRADQGFSGYPRPVTPHIDQLAAKGTVFERAYSTASYTAKAMGALMMGKYTSEATRNWDHYTAYTPANTFFAKRAHDAGVFTFAGHCHYYFQWATGYQQGFDVYDASAIAPGMADNDSSTTSARLSDLAIRLLSRPEISRLGDRRFFGWFHYFDPHSQYVRHEGAPDFAKMPGGPPARTVYDEEVWFTDLHIGRVISFIASQRWGADTAIIITADHGEAFSDAHGVKTHGHEIWESLVRVPLVVYVPDATPSRVPVKRSHIDIAPTILELLGAPAAGGQLRGKSLLGDIYARPGSPHEERDVYLDMPEGPYNEVRRALITGPTPGLKLLHLGGKRYQLFDLASDPGENVDLSTDPARLEPIRQRMEAFRARLNEVAVSGPKQ